MAFRDGKSAEPVAQPVTPVVESDRTAGALEKMLEAMTALLRAQSQSPPPSIRTCPDIELRDAINEFIVAKCRAERSERYLRQLRCSLASFAQGRGNVPIGLLTLKDCETWVFGQGWKIPTMHGYLGDVCTLLNFCVRRGYLKDNPAKGVELPQDDSDLEPPAIHTPREMAQILTFAASQCMDVTRHLAVRYFSGVRSAEAHRMREENILMDRGYVVVDAKKAKTRRRRLIKIQPVLASWLALGGELRAISTNTVSDVVKASGVKFARNVTRHSFCSYRLAQSQNAALTALEAGHSETMLFGRYREIVSQEDGALYFSLTPEAAKILSNIVMGEGGKDVLESSP